MSVADWAVRRYGSVAADDPLLTARPPGPRVATRVVLAASGELPEHCQLRTTAKDAPLLLATANAGKLTGWAADGAEVLALPSGDSGLSVDALLTELGRRRMMNVLIEGGAGVLGSFLDANAIDEAWVFIAPKLVGGPGPSPIGGQGVEWIAKAIQAAETTVERVGEDTLVQAVFSTTQAR